MIPLGNVISKSSRSSTVADSYVSEGATVANNQVVREGIPESQSFRLRSRQQPQDGLTTWGIVQHKWRDWGLVILVCVLLALVETIVPGKRMYLTQVRHQVVVISEYERHVVWTHANMHTLFSGCTIRCILTKMKTA